MILPHEFRKTVGKIAAHAASVAHNPPLARLTQDEREILRLETFSVCTAELEALIDPAIAELVEGLKPMMPITIRENQNYAEVTFGDHQTQAMTMCPADWLKISEAYDRAVQLFGEAK